MDDVSTDMLNPRLGRYERWLADMLAGGTPITKIGGFTVPIPPSRDNGLQLALKLAEAGADFQAIAQRLGYADTRALVVALNALPDEWFVGTTDRDDS